MHQDVGLIKVSVGTETRVIIHSHLRYGGSERARTKVCDVNPNQCKSGNHTKSHEQTEAAVK